MRALTALACTLIISSVNSAPAQRSAPQLLGHPAPSLRQSDRVRIAEAFRLANSLQDSIWTGWDQAPFGVLLVTPEHEFLIGHPAPPPGFEPIGYDSLLASDVLVRPRTLPPTLLATFPFAGVPTIVVGEPENTGKSSTAWMLTLLHEHFHQLQTSQPDYYQRLDALGLAHGDQSGMWMLNFPFPYDSPAVQQGFTAVSHALAAALVAIGRAEFSERVTAYQRAEEQLQEALPPEAARYLAFQLWQEGIARYTEDRIAHVAARRYTPTAAFQALRDYTPIAEVAEVADSIRAGILQGLGDPQLGARKRVAFYALGAGTGLLLDAATPEWKQRYFQEPFALPSGSAAASH